MSDHRAFLDAILAKPDDDTPRLVYADWLDDHGDAERAEFIRVQCELVVVNARLLNRFSVVDSKRFSALRRRQDDLLASRSCLDWFTAPGLAVSWTTGGFAGWIAKRKGEPSRTIGASLIYRGFVSIVSMTVADVLEYGPRLCRLTPLERIRVTDRTPYRASENGVRSWFWYKAGPSAGILNLAATMQPVYVSEMVPVEWWPEGDDQVPDPLMREFSSEQAAHDWLSERALAWSREEAKCLDLSEQTG